MAGIFSSVTYRQIGNAATTQNLFTIENTDATTVVKIRRLVMQMDATAVLTAVMPLFKTSRCAVPTGGVTLTKTKFNSSSASNANVIVRGSASADGAGNAALNATPADIVWEQFGMRVHTAVGQILAPDFDQLPVLVENVDFLLKQNEALVVHIVAAAGTSNPATNSYFIGVVWEET